MGVRLIVEVLDHAPDGATPAERLVLVVLAESANDTTRQAWPGIEVIARRTGLSMRGIRSALARLAARGLDVRVPLGVDKHGKPVYSGPRKRTTYQIPRLTNGGTTVPPLPTNGGTTVPPVAAPQRQNGGTTVPPFPHEPSVDPSAAIAARDEKLIKVIAVVHSSTDTVDDDEAAAVVELIRTEKEPENLYGFVRHLANAGELDDWLERVRADQADRAVSDAYAKALTSPPCEHGTPNGSAIHPTTGVSWFCALCRNWAAAQAGKDPWDF